jgi:hypothetical protein
LAGLLATIGNVFGQGCGKNEDLTYDGARRWLAGVPTSDRSHVHYYFTWYKQGGFPYLNNYCNLAANAILSWPNDGVVENENAVLPGGKLVFVVTLPLPTLSPPSLLNPLTNSPSHSSHHTR